MRHLFTKVCMRSGRDSNSRPPAWQAGILTNWTTRPICKTRLNRTSTTVDFRCNCYTFILRPKQCLFLMAQRPSRHSGIFKSTEHSGPICKTRLNRTSTTVDFNCNCYLFVVFTIIRTFAFISGGKYTLLFISAKTFYQKISSLSAKLLTFD